MWLATTTTPPVCGHLVLAPPVPAGQRPLITALSMQTTPKIVFVRFGFGVRPRRGPAGSRPSAHLRGAALGRRHLARPGRCRSSRRGRLAPSTGPATWLHPTGSWQHRPSDGHTGGGPIRRRGRRPQTRASTPSHGSNFPTRCADGWPGRWPWTRCGRWRPPSTRCWWSATSPPWTSRLRPGRAPASRWCPSPAGRG